MRLNEKKAVAAMKKGKKGTRPEDEDWDFLKNKYEEGMELARPWHQKWLIDIAFYVGRQYTFFNSSAWLLQQLREVKGRIRNVDNQILPKVRRQISDGIRNDPTISVVPNTDDEEDVKAAKTGDKVLKNFWRNNKMKKKVRKLRTWQYVTGNGYVHDTWNPRLGGITVSEEGKLKYRGDVDLQIYGPFNVLVPYAVFGDDELNDFPWVMIATPRTLEYLAAKHKDGARVTKENLPTQQYETNHIFGLASGKGVESQDKAVEMHLYVKPSYVFPKGVELIGANGVIFEKKDYPYDEYPLEHFKDIEVPGIFHGIATMDHAIPLQKTWNRTSSGIDEFNRMMAKGKGLAPKGCELEALPDDTHGEWLSYKPVMGHKPEIMTLKGLPQTYQMLLEITQVSLENLFSQHEVTRGTNKSDIRSGDMVRELLEQDSRGNLPSHAIFEEGLESVSSRVLKRVQKGYGDERVLKITGKEGEFESFRFKGADLRNNTDVHVKRESSMPDSRVAREAMILRRFEVGFYGDPTDREVRRMVQNMLDDAVTHDVYSDDRLDEQNARIENITMTQGGFDKLVVNRYDNHMIHYKEHNHFRKKREYQELKIKDPRLFGQMEQIIEGHTSQHLSFIKEMQAAAVEREEKPKPKLKTVKGGKE